ncbi:zinc-binding dehydrogenase [Streptomyces sp. NBC_01433]|uniref:zinc-binding dehydrogenase n=1 Tax=Streptomyces sp. NBC_01433 TaxID=2903864 RepID=UPI0022513E56|nr:zinc-binding dehydrogenase [Streptomyces sp. NBC_01433]MCX4680287.1 zinc-binding dehydrogenase [Streptomyces sp. NBC_01433]
MQAVQNSRFGPAREVLGYGAAPAPRPPGKGEVLVRQRATSVNPIDCRRRGGYGRSLLRLSGIGGFPQILGSDVSGEVVALGAGVSGLRVGDAVFGAKKPSIRGTYAQYCLVEAAEVVRKPASLSFAEAAALPYAFLSAWAALTDAGFRAESAAGRRVFLQGGTGGTGVVTLQVCKALGAHVAVTAGPQGVDLCRRLGADEVFDYRTQDFTRHLDRYDFAVCLADQSEEAKMISILRPGPGAGYATLVHPLMRLVDTKGLLRGGTEAVRTLLRHRRAQKRHRRAYAWSLFRSDRAALELLAELSEKGTVQAVIDRTYPLSAMAEAHEYSESGRAKGKIVIEID